MVFNSLEYLVFLPTVLCIYFTLKLRAQNVFLLLASWLFYGWWDWRFLSLLILTTTFDYVAALKIASHPIGSRSRKRWLLVSLSTNLGVLATFKYCNFFAQSLAAALNGLGFEANLPLLNVVLPVGVSFYTFQSLSYTIEVYRGTLRPARNFIDFALFVAFFPQLVAGPIERATRLLPAVQNPRYVDIGMLSSGLGLILIGLFRKLCIADAVSPEVTAAFQQPDDLSGPELLRGAYLFALQIYGDFAGYSDMARGSARLFGIELMVNFNQPYLSKNITEFWRRWHISLSTWLKDYLYIPLGGSRQGRFATYRNLFMTMLIGGLWHGANWTYVLWGALHGSYLAIHKAIGGTDAARPVPTAGGWSDRLKNLCKIVGTFHLVLLGWILFRSDNLAKAWEFLDGLRHGWNANWYGLMGIPLGFLLLTLALDIPQYLAKEHDVIERLSMPKRALAYSVLLALVFFLGGAQSATFIYFQF